MCSDIHAGSARWQEQNLESAKHALLTVSIHCEDVAGEVMEFEPDNINY